MSICGPASGGAVKQLASAIGDRDQAVRNAALNCMLSVHMHIGERLYKQVSHLGQKEMGMLEERIKRSAGKPGPRISLGPGSLGPAGRYSGCFEALLNILMFRNELITRVLQHLTIDGILAIDKLPYVAKLCSSGMGGLMLDRLLCILMFQAMMIPKLLLVSLIAS